jgi:acyl-CoA synthetase (AMP-forming)/AMP-acid ligase II
MLLELAADAMGDRVAIGSRTDGLTYAELRRRAVAAAPGVASSANGTLTFLDTNGPAVPVALFTAAWAGISYAPVNYRLPGTVLQQLVQRLGTGVVVGDEEHLAQLGEGGPAERHRSDAWLRGLGETAGDEPLAYPDDPDRPAILLFTSGTSAAPKAAVLDHDNLLAYILGAGDFASAEEDEAVLMSVPPFHIAGVAGVLSSIYACRRIVPIPRFTPEDWLEAARREEVTHAFLVPTMLARIVAVMEAEGGVAVPSLRAISYGGARMPVPVLERALRLFPNAGFVNAYGLTETSSTVALLGPDDHRAALESDDETVRARLGSVGQPLPGVEIEVVDDDAQPVPPGVTGRLRIRGPQVAGNYVGEDSAVDAEGWLLTGDLGRVDEGGYLFVEGRADDVIIAGGENISPGEIEDCLLRHPAVTGAAVVGVPDEEWGEQVAAMVTTSDPALDSTALTEWVRGELGSLKTPKILEIRAELPMTPTGKILRREVRTELGPVGG